MKPDNLLENTACLKSLQFLTCQKFHIFQDVTSLRKSFNAFVERIELRNKIKLAYRNSWTLDARVGRWTLDAGLWTLDSGRCTLDTGRWTLDAELWTLDAELWTLDAGLSTLNSGRWMLDCGNLKLSKALETMDPYQ